MLHAQVERYKQVFQGTVDAVIRFSCNTIKIDVNIFLSD